MNLCHRPIIFLFLVGALAAPAVVAVHPQSASESQPNTRIAGGGTEWPVVGGDWGGTHYSTLSQVTRNNVKDLAGAWVSKPFDDGASSKSTPVIRDGLMFLTAGPGVYALNAKTGEVVWKRRTTPGGAGQQGSQVGGYLPVPSWHGVAVGDGKVFVGIRNGHVMALREKTGEVIWDRQVGDDPPLRTVQVSEATTYWQGMLFAGMGGDWGIRARVLALDANTGKELWRFYITPGPGETGHETWPQKSDIWKWGGGGVWMEAAIDPDLGLVYYVTGNAVPQFGGELRAGDNLFTSSIVALDIKTGKLRWYYQLIHHDVWEHDIGTPPIMYDAQVGGQARKAIGVMRTDGYLFFLDRATGKPVLPVEERPVPQDAFSKTSPTQPFTSGGESLLPGHAFWKDKIPPAFVLASDFTPKKVDVPNLLELGQRVIRTPMSYSPQTGYFYAQANAGLVWVPRTDDPYYLGPMEGYVPKVPGLLRFATLAAIDTRTGKIAWKKEMPIPLVGKGGTLNTAGGVMFHLGGDGHFIAYDERTGDVLSEFQTGYAGGAGTPAAYEINGEQHIAVPVGPVVWAFKLGGSVRPPPAPILPPDDDPFTGPIEDTGQIETASLQRGQLLAGGLRYATDEYAFNPYRARVRVGTRVTWVNNGRQVHTIQAQDGSWTTGRLIPGAVGFATFDKPGKHTYICKDHPWTYGQLIVTEEQTHDGFYTEAQAGRGSATYAQSCSACHGEALGGQDPAPSLVGNAFMLRWVGRNLSDLFNLMRATMPPTGPGKLSEEAYFDLVAFLLRANQLPAGKEELRIGSTALGRTLTGR